MLYIFWVNNGTMMTFDVNLAIETVDNLKRAIYEQYKIPIMNQVLLISGGESLLSHERVCQYSSAGTDTSPIFLFCKNYELSSLDNLDQTYASPSSSSSSSSQAIAINKNNYSINSGIDDDNMKERVKSCLKMEPNFNTVVCRNEMAIQLYEQDSFIYHRCERLLHDQHLQQQSWAAVVANLEDIVQSFENKTLKIKALYRDILKNKPTYLNLLENFKKDKEILSRIPILNSLIMNTSTSLINENNDNKELTLLEWILKNNNHSKLDELYCYDELLNDYDSDKLKKLEIDIDMVLNDCNKNDMKEVKGLTQRLSALEQLIRTAKKIFDKQGIVTEGFKQNQSRLSNLKDRSILPDLCQTHVEQLQTMLDNHLELIDLEKKFRDAKYELSANINQRLRWIIHIEEKLKQVDDTIVFVGIKLQKIRKKLDVIHNLHECPKIYFDSIVEVLRRKTFSQMFYDWAEMISEQSKQLIENEQSLRLKFSEQIDNHFIRCFFPGMNDMPENFIDEPIRIDQSLPQLSMEDVEYLRKKIPETFSDDYLMPLSNVPDLFSMSKLQENNNKSTIVIEHNDIATATELSMNDIENHEMNVSILNAKNIQIENLKNDLNHYQELFEKHKKSLELFKSNQDEVAKNFNEFQKLLKNNFFDYNNDLIALKSQLNTIEDQSNQMKVNEMNDKKMIDELNEKITRNEDELKQNSSKIASLKHKLSEEKVKNEECWKQIQEQYDKIESQTNTLNNNRRIINHIKQISMNHCEKIQNYKCEILNLFMDLNSNRLPSVNKMLNELQKQYEIAVEMNKEKIIQEKDQQIQKLRDQLNFEHKNELETLRQRFKLAISTTSIERTASETSLEKVQLDIVDQSAQDKEIQKLKQFINDQKIEYEQSMKSMKNDYDTMIQSLRNDMEKQQSQLLSLRKKSLIIQQQQPNNNQEYEMLNNDFIKQKLSLYDNLLSCLTKHLDQRTSGSNNDQNIDAKQILHSLKNDLDEFNQNVDALNSRSVISLPTTSITTPDSPKLMSKSSKQLMVNLDTNIEEKITVNSCEIGNTVLVYYEKKYENFIVYTKLNDLHYIHSDSLKECDLSKDPITNEHDWIIAKITEKEYCQIRKEENRYRLPVNTKFYRVKIQQISKCPANSEKLKQLIANCNNRVINTMTTSLLIQSPSSSSIASSSTSTTPGNRNLLSNFMSLFASSSSGASGAANDGTSSNNNNELQTKSLINLEKNDENN